MFQQFLNRAEKLNLRSSRDTQLFYRVVKVCEGLYDVEYACLCYLSAVLYVVMCISDISLYTHYFPIAPGFLTERFNGICQ